MTNELWQDCLACKTKCCCEDIAYPLFLTPEEKERHKELNTKRPCAFFDERKLCTIHDSCPVDCKLFPFDFIKINGELFWIIWKISCPITEKRQANFETYLSEHEKNLLPDFKEHIEKYAAFRCDELKQKYGYEIIRELKT